MDSPEVPETTTAPAAAANSIGSPVVQESPFSNYLSNLSPIKPVKNSRILQGYADLSSPPLVFTSPHIVSKCEPSSLQRPRCPRMETPKGNVGNSYVDAAPDLEKCDSFLSSKSNVDIQKDGDHSSYSKEQHCSPSGFVDEYLSEPVDAECADCVQSVMTEPSVGPLGVANLQTNTLNGDADKEALPSSGQGSNNCALPSDGLPCETLPVQANEDYYEHVELEDPGASQQHRGMSRRCLQFEEAQGIVQGSAPAMNSPNSSTNLICTRLPFSSGGIENSKMLNPGISAPSGKRKMINLTRGIISIHPPNQNTKAKLSISRRSGIGLHLNSIVRASAMECNANESMKTHVEENERCSAQLSDSVEKVLTPVGDRMLENQAAPAPAAMTSTSDSLPTVKSADAMQSFEPNEPPQEKKTISSEHSESFNEFNQSSPKKKRKKFTPDDNGCKRCNCKKTKCLKLYCDCFAAGIYCADSCSCQGCFNRPEYEDTVLETRQLIESRNPLAFAPKIVHQASKVHAAIGEEVNRTTPASARHKRGCNCKRSMCLKKYCECYQSSVGCSSGCRCEGCKNVFGRKEDYSIVEEIINTTTSNDARTDIVDEKSAMAIHSNDLLHTQPSDLHSPAPFTPHCQFSDHGNDAQKHRPFTTSYLPSPKPSSPTQPGGINGNGNPLAEIEDCRDMEFTIAEMIGEFSPPKLDPISDTCYLSPQEPPQFGGGRRVSSSLRWRGSPVTPTPCLGESKTHQGEEEEDAATTPDTVKESCNPIQSVKATSPNKKRVSISPPPHHPHSKAFDLRSVAAGGGFRSGSGRKFFLKGVPSFPSLSPCMMATELPKQQQHEEEKL